MFKLVGVRWIIAARAKSDERKKIEHFKTIKLLYLVGDPLLSMYKVTRNN